MTGEQMSIFDFIQEPEENLEEMDEEEIIRKIEEGTGLRFRLNPRFGNYYEYKINKTLFYIHISRYEMEDNQNRFIGVGWEKGSSGGSAPRDSVKEAVSWLKKKIATLDF